MYGPLFASAMYAFCVSTTPASPLWMSKAGSSAPLVNNLPNFRPLLKESMPAVVHIFVDQKVKQEDSRLRFGPFEFLNPFLGPQGRHGPGSGREFRQQGSGSGFIIHSDGYILTNYHVVEDAQSIKIKFLEEVSAEELTAKVIGSDPRTDIALLKIQSKRLFPALPLGDSDEAQVGDWAVAIGNPFGLDHSVSVGIISAKGRRDVMPQGRPGLYDFIQTDASINPGNSGGPLLNLRGEVVGMNAAINASGQGIGFAIPVNLIKNVVSDLKEKGKVTRSWLGVYVQRMDDKLAKSYALERPQGAIVSEVVDASPAQKAGIQAGDVILEFGGKAIKTHSDLQFLAGRAAVGQMVELVVLRDRQKRTLKVKMQEIPQDQNSPEAARSASGVAELGCELNDLTPELRQRYQLQAKAGAVVTEIASDGAAEEAGLQVGDVILKVGDEEIRSAKQLPNILKKSASGDTLRLIVMRQKSTLLIGLVKP